MPYGTEPCASCAAAHCCPESVACGKDSACAAYAQCVGPCNGEPTCRATCGVDSPPPASSQGSALAACLVAKCENECRLTCGSPASLGVPPSAASTCQDCIVAKGGCDVTRACGASADCERKRRCTALCTNEDCLEACDPAWDGGRPPDTAFTNVFQTCATECDVGGDWTCVGHRSWPPPKSDKLTLTVQVQHEVTGAPFSGLDVAICDPVDFECLHPKAPLGSTDSMGRAVFELQNSASVGGGGINGYIQLTSSEIIPFRSYWNSPLSESKVTFSFQVPTPDDFQQQLDSVGATWDQSQRGVIYAVPFDCVLNFAPGVEVAISPTATDVKVVYGLSPTSTATGSLALVIFTNVPTGLIDVVATPLALGNKPSSRQSVYVRAGWITAVGMIPTP